MSTATEMAQATDEAVALVTQASAEETEKVETYPAGFEPGRGSAHDLIPEWMEVPPLYSGEGRDDPLVVVKLFTPDSNWTWYITEYDGEDTCFGLVVGFETELGYFSISEIAGVKGPLGLRIERDLWFEPTPITQLREYHAEWGEHGGPYKSTPALPHDQDYVPLPDAWTVEDIAYLLGKLADGPILVADGELGLPTIHDFASVVEHLGFGVMKVTTADYTITYDAGSAMQRTPGGQGWTRVSVTAGEFPYDTDRVRATLQAYLDSNAGDGAQANADRHCDKCGQAWAVHNDDGSCVADECVGGGDHQDDEAEAEAQDAVRELLYDDEGNLRSMDDIDADRAAELIRPFMPGEEHGPDKVFQPMEIPRGAVRIGYFPDLDVPDGIIWTADVRSFRRDGGGIAALRGAFDYLQAMAEEIEARLGFKVLRVSKDYDDRTFAMITEGDGERAVDDGALACEIASWGVREVTLMPADSLTLGRRIEHLVRNCYPRNLLPEGWHLPGLDLAAHLRGLVAGAYADLAEAHDRYVRWDDLRDAWCERAAQDRLLGHLGERIPALAFGLEPWVKGLPDRHGGCLYTPRQWRYVPEEERRGKLAEKFEGDADALLEALDRNPNETRLDCILSALADLGVEVPRRYMVVRPEQAGAPQRVAGDGEQEAAETNVSVPAADKPKPDLPEGIPQIIEVDMGHTRGWAEAQVLRVKGRWLHYALAGTGEEDKVQLVGRDIIWRAPEGLEGGEVDG